MNSSRDENQLAAECAVSFSMDSSTDAGSSSAVSGLSSPLASLSPVQAPTMDACREFYERRVQSLERFRRRVISCQQIQNSENSELSKSPEPVQYLQLQSDMVSCKKVLQFLSVLSEPRSHAKVPFRRIKTRFAGK